MIGERVAAAMERGEGKLLREMIAHGMEIGNHSYNHPHDLPTRAKAPRFSSNGEPRNRTRDGLYAVPLSTSLRQPNARTGAAGEGPRPRHDALGRPAEDWQHPGANVISERVLSAVKPGAIVTLHDNTEMEGQTVEALPRIIEGLEARG